MSHDAPRPAAYAELAATSNFSFLRGASHPRDLVLAAILQGQRGLGVADRNTVAGVVRAWSALRSLREEGLDAATTSEDLAGDPALATAIRQRAAAFHLITGARLAFSDGAPDVLAYPENLAGWSRLTRLLTLGSRRTRKGGCDLTLDDLLADIRDLQLIVMPPARLGELTQPLQRIAEAAPGAVWLGACMWRRGDDRRRLFRLRDMAARAGARLLAVNDVLYHAPGQRDLHDIITCIREKTTVAAAGRLLEINAERWLKAPDAMARLFQDAPDAIAATGDFLQRIHFDLSQIAYQYPDEPVPQGYEPQGWLEELVRRKVQTLYPQGATEKVQRLLHEELTLIAELRFAPYFLTVHDIVQEARRRDILCQGRGSAANSAVCYVLGITSVDPDKHELLFARFLSSDRGEPPDIDVDFEHERREEIIQYIYERYGRHRAGIAATVIRYRPRSAIREVGKALGLTEDVTARIAGSQWGSYGENIPDSHIAQAGLDAGNPAIRRAVALATRLIGFPRHLSQHVGGFILTRDRLDDLVPIGNAAMAERTFIEWDKDDIDALRLLKVDVLALGMLTCIRKAFDLLRQHRGEAHDLASVALTSEQEAGAPVYAMLKTGDSIGVFQVESRAQINMLPRLKPERFYDLVIQVAIVRPGPIQGDMVHPYLRRRAGVETVDYPSPLPPHPPNELRGVLERTKGVPLFQEQAMQVAMVAAGFSGAQANGLRKAMGTFRGDGTLHRYETLMVGGMTARGYDRDFAERCFAQIRGFGSYGFPESHAAAFALLVYVSAWIKCYHPAAFACALLNSQPMGFYGPAQIIGNAKDNGVTVLAVDVAHSHWDNTLEAMESGLALRLGFRQIDGFRQEWADAIVRFQAEQSAIRAGASPAGPAAMRQNSNNPPPDMQMLQQRALLPRQAILRLAEADAFRSMGLDRRAALWAAQRLPDDAPLPLFLAMATPEQAEEVTQRLPQMTLGEHVAADYQTLRLSLKAHPMQILRPLLAQSLTCDQCNNSRQGVWVCVTGVVLVRQRPGTGNAIFITLEDETGVINAVLWASMFARFRRAVMSARVMEISGVIERSPEHVVHLMAKHITDRSELLGHLSGDIRTDGPDATLMHRHPRDIRILPGSRDFH
ncbi:error-prone DNA polymerase [Camelimonas sp. ID_303_24]